MVRQEREQELYGAIKAEDERVWQAMRRCGIGGSDASVVLGVNPYRNIHHLRADKRRGVKVRQNAAMTFGSIMEDFILEAADDLHELDLLPGAPLGTLYAYARPWQLANVDGYAFGDDGEVAYGIEIKQCSEGSRRLWRDGPPAHYIAQIQHYMAVTGWPAFHIHCMVAPSDRKELLLKRKRAHDRDQFCRDVAARSEIMSYEVPRDETYIDELTRAEERVWRWIMGRKGR